MDAADETFFRHELAQTQREIRVVLQRLQRLQDGLGSGPVEYRLTVSAVRQQQRKGQVT